MKLKGQQCRCGGCGELFRSLSGFDKHRQGPYTDRLCLSVARLTEMGWQKNAKGFWMRPSKKSQVHRRAA